MLPLLALGVGLASGARVIAEAERKSDEKKLDAQAEIQNAFDKKLAEYKAKAVYEMSPAGQTIDEMMRDRKQLDTLATERAKSAVAFETEDFKQRRAQAQSLAIRQSLGSQEQMSLAPEFLITELGGEIPQDAAFSFRRVNSWGEDGQPAQLEDAKGNRYMDVSPGHYIPRGTDSKDRLNNALVQVSGKQYEWWKRTNPNLASSWEGRIGSLMEQAALDYSRTVDPERSGVISARLPRLPESIANSVADAYGAEFTIKIIENIFNDAQPLKDRDGNVISVKQQLRETYKYVYGMEPKRDAKVVMSTSRNEKTEEAEIVATHEDKSLELDMGNRPYDEVTRKTIENVGKNLNMAGASHDSVVAEIHGLAKYNNRTDKEVFDAVINTRAAFRNAQYQGYVNPERPQSGRSRELFNIWNSGTGTQSVEVWNAYRDTMGIMTKLDTNRSIMATALIAPINALDRQTPEERLLPKGPASLYSFSYFKQPDIEDLSKRDDEYTSYIETTYLGGQKISDIVNKAEAAEDTVLITQALEQAYTDSPAIPGAVGGVIDIINGFQAQFGYMLKAIDASSDSEQQKEKNRKKIQELRDNITSSIANVDTTNEIAVANAVQKYYEGVLVYTMAMALQGGNAAARTISDADIERIQNLLNFGATLGDTRVKVAVMKAIGKQMERQAVLGRAYSAKNEAVVWSAYTLEQDAISRGQGYKDFVFAAIEDEVNRASSGAFYKTNPRAGSTISLPGGGSGVVQSNGEIKL
jgi:hypothetical protein